MPDLRTCLQFNHFYPDSFPVTRNFEIDRWNSELAYIARSNMAALWSGYCNFSQRLLKIRHLNRKFLCACHSEKQIFGFLKRDPRNKVLFNLSGLSRTATGTRRWSSFLNLCQWIFAQWRNWGDGLSSKEETRQTCLLSTYASLEHFWAFSSTRWCFKTTHQKCLSRK